MAAYSSAYGAAPPELTILNSELEPAVTPPEFPIPGRRVEERGERQC